MKTLLQILQRSQWRAYRKLPSLFLKVPSLTPYDLPFPCISIQKRKYLVGEKTRLQNGTKAGHVGFAAEIVRVRLQFASQRL